MENVLSSNKENKIENNNTEENIETSNEVITEKLETKGLKLKRNTKKASAAGKLAAGVFLRIKIPCICFCISRQGKCIHQNWL